MEVIENNELEHKSTNFDKKVAITFDDSSNEQTTPEILKILLDNDVIVTFFLLGRNAETYPEIIKDIKLAIIPLIIRS